MGFRTLITVASLLAALPCLAGDGNWIAVVAPGLQESVKPLVEQREREGWVVTVIPAEETPDPAMERIRKIAGDGLACCVLLVGDLSLDAGPCRVPSGVGTWLRMKGKPTDQTWAAGGGKTKIEVGRLPARTPAEADTMVKKVLAWPRETEVFPKGVLLAGHHGAPPSIASLANGLTNSLTLGLVKELPPHWRFNGASANDGSPWQVPDSDLTTLSRSMMTTHSTFLAYMGHSSPHGAASRNSMFLTSGEWKALPADGHRPGVFFTCGCHSCELDTKFESYGFAAMRAPGGPPAVIGSHGESWSSMGFLAASGLIGRLAKESDGIRLGELWLGVRQGLEVGKISAATFAMLDRADGTGGKVPLAQQRKEHLESWMLLGDPAMTLRPKVSSIQIHPPAAPVAGTPLDVRGTLPTMKAGVSVKVSLELHPSKVRDLAKTAVKDVVIASAVATAEGSEFAVKLDMPEALPSGPWTLRVESLKPELAGGILRINASPKHPENKQDRE